MSRKCQKCGRSLSQDAFICTDCGHILGDSTNRIKVPKPEKPSQKCRSRLPIICLATSAVLFVAALLLVLLGGRGEGGEPEYVTYTVRVITQDNDPVVGAVIQLLPDGENPTLEETTDVNGCVHFSAPAGEQVCATIKSTPQDPAISYSAEFGIYEFEADRTLDIHVWYNGYTYVPYVPDNVFTVVVLDQHLKPVEGVGLLIDTDSAYDSGAVGYTDKNGSYRFSRTPSENGTTESVQIFSVPDGYRNFSLSVNPLPNDENVLYLQIQKTDSLIILPPVEWPTVYSTIITVKDQFGEPVSGVIVRMGATVTSGDEMTTDSNGKIVHTDTIKKQYYVWIVSVPEGYTFETSKVYSVQSGGYVHITIQRIDGGVMPVTE